jgi:hypothetical protein
LSGFSFDDPAVAYQAILPNFSSFKRPNESGNGYVDGALKLDEWTSTHAFSKSVAISRGAERIRVLWAGAKMAREVGVVDTIHRAFMPLAFCPSVARRGTGDAVAGRRVRPADRR